MRQTNIHIRVESPLVHIRRRLELKDQAEDEKRKDDKKGFFTKKEREKRVTIVVCSGKARKNNGQKNIIAL